MPLAQLLAGTKQLERGRRLRRGFGVHFYVGRNGSGKSLCAVYDTLPDLAAGRKVLSTVRLTDFENPRPCDDDSCTARRHGLPGHLAAHPNYVPFTDWSQLIDFEKGVVFLDEITGIADSANGNVPAAAENLLAQLRRDELFVRITALNFIRAAKRLREAASAVTRCQSFMPVTVQGDDGQDRLWRQRRLAVWRTYDAQSLPVDDHTDAAYEKADLLGKSKHWIPTSPALNAYDTYERVLTVGDLSEVGLCVHCYGTRRRPECSCDDYVSAKVERRAGASIARREAPRSAAPPVITLEASRSSRRVSGSR